MNAVEFEDTVASTLKSLPPGAVLLASISGGADSIAMLAALVAIRDRQDDFPFELRCIHVNHGIRPAAETRGDAKFVHSLCKQWHIRCHIDFVGQGRIAAVAKKKGLGIEAAARMFRRQAWFRCVARIKERWLDKANGRPVPPVQILTAHTADDMLETALMRIFQGSGPSGLAAMPARRGPILRPLITLSRCDVLDYLAEKELTWREDSTNADIHFLRNRIRHRLIPQLNKHFPQWRDAITSFAKTQSRTAEFIGDEAASRILWGDGNAILGVNSLSTEAKNFFAQPAIIREEALFQGINLLGFSGKIKRVNVRRFADGKATAVDLGPLEIRNTAEQVVISTKARGGGFPAAHCSEFGFSLLIYEPGSYSLKDMAIVDVYAIKAADTSTSEQSEKDGVFFTSLPVVVRMDNGIVELNRMPPAIDGKRYAVQITPEKGRVDV